MSYSADEMIISESDFDWIRDGDSEITQVDREREREFGKYLTVLVVFQI